MSRLLSCSIIIFLSLLSASVVAADLFGDAGHDLVAQKKAYTELFGDVEAGLRASKQKLQFANDLSLYLEDVDYAHVHIYLCQKIIALINKDRSLHADRIRLAVFDFMHQDGNVSQQETADLIELLENILSKSKGPDQGQICDRILNIHTRILREAMLANEMKAAASAAKYLEKWYKKLGEETFYVEIKAYQRAIKQRMREEKQLPKLESAALAGAAEDLERYIYYAFESARVDEALNVATTLHDQYGHAAPMLLLRIYKSLLKQEDVNPTEAAQTALHIHLLLKQEKISLFLAARLLNMGVALESLIQDAHTLDKQLLLRCQIATRNWKDQLAQSPLLIESLSSLPVTDYSALGFGKRRGGTTMLLGADDSVQVQLPAAFLAGHFGAQFEANIGKDLKGKHIPAFNGQAVIDDTLWSGTAPPIVYDDKSDVLVIAVGASTVSGHGDRFGEAEAVAGLRSLLDQLMVIRPQVVLLTLPVMIENPSFKTEVGGARFEAGAKMNDLVMEMSEEYAFSVVDCYSLSLRHYKKNPELRCYENAYSNKVTEDGYAIVLNALRDFFGLAQAK